MLIKNWILWAGILITSYKLPTLKWLSEIGGGGMVSLVLFVFVDWMVINPELNIEMSLAYIFDINSLNCILSSWVVHRKFLWVITLHFYGLKSNPDQIVSLTLLIRHRIRGYVLLMALTFEASFSSSCNSKWCKDCQVCHTNLIFSSVPGEVVATSVGISLVGDVTWK